MAANYLWEFTTGTTLLSNLTLTISGSGSGSVNSNAPAPGFNCSSSACAAQFSQDSSLTLTAVPGSGSIFSAWSGDCPPATGISCTVSMNTDRNISASFIITPPVHILDGDYFDSLQEAFNAPGTPICTIRAQEGNTIANPDGAQMAANYLWEFTTGTILLSNLSLTVSGSGSGSVNSHAPAPGFNCSSSACAAQFSQDSSLTLTAVPGSGSIFSGWSGDCPPETGISCTVSMNTNRNISASFIVTPPVHILDGDYFDSIQEAFKAAGTPICTIRAQEGKLNGDLNIDAFSDITLAGGFDSDYTDNNSGFTTLDGILTIVHGSLTVENLVIE